MLSVRGMLVGRAVETGFGKILEIIHLLKLQIYIIKRSKADEILNQEKVMFKIRLGIAQWMYFSKLHLLKVGSGEVKLSFSAAFVT